MTEPGLFPLVGESRDVALAIQVLPVSGPTLEAHSQCESLNFSKESISPIRKGSQTIELYSRRGQMKALYSVRRVVVSACL